MLLKKIAAAAAAFLMAGAAAAQRPAAYAPPPPLQPENAWHLDLSTGGRVTVQLRPDVAPGHVQRIRALTERGFYNGLVFHRVIDGFMAQGGDPTGTGNGGSDLPDLAAEFNPLPHLRGAVAMARTQAPNSANSQFYIMLAPGFVLDNQYTVFGRVVAGMAFVDAIERGEPPANPTRIVRASMGSQNLAPLSEAQLRAAAGPAASAMPATPPPVQTIAPQPPRR
jgi:peptidylprolyl isomerase